jgi:transcriptional regulator with XRE-family HTH domain
MMIRMDTRELVGEWIAVRREQLGYTQGELAEAIGVTNRTISAVENGASEVKSGSRLRWEEALGWEPGSLTVAYRRQVKPVVSEKPVERQLEAVVVHDAEWYEAEREWVRRNFGPGNERDWLIDKLDRDEDVVRMAARERAKLSEAWRRMGRDTA